MADSSFSGSMGDVQITLGRIPGDTLIFIIPNVGEGPAELVVTTGNQVRTWNLHLIKWQDFQDQEIFINTFLASSRTLQNKIQETDELKELASQFGTWINFFTQKQQKLSDLEKENNLFFRNAYDRQLQCQIGLGLMKRWLLKG